MTEARVALAFVPDLFFAVKIRGMLQHAGWQVSVASTTDVFAVQLAQMPKPAVAIVDIGARTHDWASIIASAHAERVPVLAFGSHMDTDAQSTARKVGATRVIANSKLADDIVAQVEQTIVRAAKSLPADDEM